MAGAAVQAISKLALRAQQSQLPALREQVDNFTLPQTRRGEWIIVRQLSVSGSIQSLGTAVHESADEKIQRAGSPGSNREAVRFSSLANLLAALSADMLCGRQHWYWRRWRSLFQRPVADALTELWSEQIRLLPAVCEQLASNRQLAEVWQALDTRSCEALLFEMHRQCGIADLREARTPLTLPDQEATSSSAPSRTALPSVLAESWSTIFRSAAKVPSDTQQRLAAVIALLQSSPQRLQLPPEVVEMELRQTIASMRLAISAVSPVFENTAESALSISAEAKTVTAKVDDNTKQSAEVIEQQQVSETKNASPIDSDIEAAKDTAGENPLAEESVKADQEARAVKNVDAATELQTTESDHSTTAELADEEAVYIAEAGVFLLINILGRQPLQTVIAEQGVWQQLDSAWLLIYRMASRLGLTDQSTIALLAALAGLESAEELKRNAETQLSDAAVERLLAECRDLYPSIELGSALLQKPARIERSDAYIDVFFPEQCVDIELRLAGIDINPGWVSWLGCVLQFHYGPEPELLEHYR